jgi:hypothetical protein
VLKRSLGVVLGALMEDDVSMRVALVVSLVDGHGVGELSVVNASVVLGGHLGGQVLGEVMGELTLSIEVELSREGDLDLVEETTVGTLELIDGSPESIG